MKLTHAAFALLVTGLCLAATVVEGQDGSSTGYVPFTMEHRRGALMASPVDVSFLLDGPAGSHGYLHAANGHIVDGQGRRVRLWGVNITEWSKGSTQIPSKADAPLWASTLARFGVNCVRLQFLDLLTPRGLIDGRRKDTRVLDAEALNREDYFLYELEKRGIYLDINLLVGRPFKAGDGVADAGKLGEGAKATSMFDKRMIELQKEYARELLAHTNPYSHHTYADDPGVAIVEINNENSIQVGYHMPSSFYASELEGIYNRWLPGHTTPDQLAMLHQQGRVDPLGPLPLMQSYNDFENRPGPRFYAEANFYTDLQQAYYADMRSYLKQTLGVKSMILGSADHHHAASGYPTVLANSRLDIIDGHTYWQHPEVAVPKGPMVQEPYNSTVAELSRSAVAGMPYTVSETNNAYPNDYAGEGIPILAAYGALQDWDAILWYTFEPKMDPQWQSYVGDAFDISLDPVKMPELAAGALMFLRGDVAPAAKTVTRSYSVQQVFDSMLLSEKERPFFTPGLAKQLPFESGVRVGAIKDKPGLPAVEPAKAGPLLSDTGQLAWYAQPPEAAVVMVDTLRTEALVGFVSASGKSVAHLAAKIETPFATLVLSSLDGQPLELASRLLLVAGGAVHNTGQQWNGAGSGLKSWGGPPTLIQQVHGTVTLQAIGPALSVLVQPLDGAGQPHGATVSGVGSGPGNWSFPVGATPTTWYLISVRR